jgi:hypothetical protein
MGTIPRVIETTAGASVSPPARHVIAIDPGCDESALLVWDGFSIQLIRFGPNEDILRLLQSWTTGPRIVPLVIEKVACFGMPVGAEVFETVFWSGRFAQAYGAERTHRITRGDVKLHLCHTMRAKDPHVRQAILDRFGGKEKAVGKKAAPGVLYGIHSHMWSALAVALVWHDQNLRVR